ncbi:LapA family protein [Yoonia sp. 208BN28-4]|uniref:LapA family protein n=1 Tax=Yoonia sp. 208BN28-4 TaxID=3126505 RepID=UPI0030B66591
MKTIRYAFWAVIGLCLILIGLANREIVSVSAMPRAVGDLLGISPDINLPLFVVMFLGVGAGLLIGFLWEWVREHHVRAEKRAKEREVRDLRAEVNRLKSEGKGDQDDVLALLDKSA